jgi:integrase/recombinase XerC
MSRHKALNPHQPLLPEWLALALNNFLAHLRDRNCAEGTVSKRKDGLLAFCDFLHERNLPRFQDLTLQDLDAFRLRLQQRGYSANTTYSSLVSLRLFYRFLEAAAIVFESPISSFHIPKPTRTLPFVLTHDQVKKLLQTPDPQTPQGQRDRALLELLYAAGLRRGECAALTVHDLDLDRHVVAVTGKGNKQRLVPFGKQAAAALQRYLTDGRNYLLRGLPDPGRLWLGNKNAAPLGDTTLRLILRKHLFAAGLPKQADIHTLRRTCATHMLQGGAHPIAVAAMLGHSDLTSLSHYLQVTLRDLQKTHAASKPGQ